MIFSINSIDLIAYTYGVISYLNIIYKYPGLIVGLNQKCKIMELSKRVWENIFIILRNFLNFVNKIPKSVTLN